MIDREREERDPGGIAEWIVLSSMSRMTHIKLGDILSERAVLIHSIESEFRIGHVSNV